MGILTACKDYGDLPNIRSAKIIWLVSLKVHTNHDTIFGDWNTADKKLYMYMLQYREAMNIIAYVWEQSTTTYRERMQFFCWEIELEPIKNSPFYIIIEAIDSLFGRTVFVRGSVVFKSDGIVMQVCKLQTGFNNRS